MESVSRLSRSRNEDMSDDSSFTTKRPVNFLRLGKTRQNRQLTLSHVNKRLQSYTKDYNQYLFTVCSSLQISLDQISAFKASASAETIREVIQQNSNDIDAIISSFPPSLKLIGSLYTPLITFIIQSYHNIKQISQKASYLSLELVGILINTCKQLESSPYLFLDPHTVQILSWWLPQQIEMLSALLLLSEPSADGNKQSLSTGVEIFQSFLEKYENNLVITVYLLLGGYLIECPLINTISKSELGATEEELLKEVQENFSSITELIRSCVQPKARTTRPYLDNRQSSFYELSMGDTPMGNDAVTWKSITNKMPRTVNSSNYLFLLSVPDEIRFHMGLDGSPSRVADINNLSIIERIETIGISFDTMRENWPTHFTENSRNWLFRLLLLDYIEATSLQQVSDVSFMAPESLEAITLFLESLDKFILFLVLLVHREATPSEAENYFGEIIVLIRFLAATLNKMNS